MKAHQVLLLIVDHDRVGDGIKDVIENTRYPNRCIDPLVMAMRTVDLGEWTDRHPLNVLGTMTNEYRRLFGTRYVATCVNVEGLRVDVLAVSIDRHRAVEAVRADIVRKHAEDQLDGWSLDAMDDTFKEGEGFGGLEIWTVHEIQET